MKQRIIREIYDTDEKRAIMKDCDASFTISVINRTDYSSLFEKIDKKALFFAAYVNEEIAGYSSIYVNDFVSFEAYLTLFCIKKEMQRMHLGSELMDRNILEAKKQGMKKLRLEVLKKDLHAIAFYEHYGFQKDLYQTKDSIFMSIRL